MSQTEHMAWITWEKQVRNRSLSSQFEATLFELDYKNSRIVRYLRAGFKTISILFSYRKKTVFVQNPSVVLAFLAVFFRPFFRYLLVVDAHNSSIFPSNSLVRWMSDFAFKHAHFTIVTNSNLAEIVRSKSGRPLIIPDPLPSFPERASLIEKEVNFNKVVFICSWAEDEPYFEVFKAAEQLPDFKFYITGKSKNKESLYDGVIPSNIVLTGYLSEHDYLEMLVTSAFILDLTTRDDCLVCGAYEATELERPFIVSDKLAIKQYFVKGCVYSPNTSNGIIDAILYAKKNYTALKKEIISGRFEMAKSWQERFTEIQKELNSYK